jgi:hypothetical protein
MLALLPSRPSAASRDVPRLPHILPSEVMERNAPNLPAECQRFGPRLARAATGVGITIENAIGVLGKSGLGLRCRYAIEAVQDGVIGAAWADHINRAGIGAPSFGSRAVEISVGSLHQTGQRSFPVLDVRVKVSKSKSGGAATTTYEKSP